MQPLFQACTLQMDIDHVTDGDTPSLHRAVVIECRIFGGATALGVGRVVALEVLGGCPCDPIVLAAGDQQVEMRLGLGPIHGLRTMKGIGDGQTIPGNGGNQVAHEIHVLARAEFLGQGEFPFFKRDAVGSFVAFGRTKVGVRILLRPRGQIARACIHQVLVSLARDIA